MKKSIFILLTVLTLHATQSWAATAIINTDGDTLLGFDDVLVDGELYNARFVDGSFTQIFGTQGVIFPDRSWNINALFELADTLDEYYQNFWSPFMHVLPEGIVRANLEQWRFMSAYRYLSPTQVLVHNLDYNDYPTYPHDAFHILGDTTPIVDFVWVQWTPVSAVPIPAAVWLFGSGLLGLIGYSKRKKTA